MAEMQRGRNCHPTVTSTKRAHKTSKQRSDKVVKAKLRAVRPDDPSEGQVARSTGVSECIGPSKGSDKVALLKLSAVRRHRD